MITALQITIITMNILINKRYNNNIIINKSINITIIIISKSITIDITTRNTCIITNYYLIILIIIINTIIIFKF